MERGAETAELPFVPRVVWLGLLWGIFLMGVVKLPLEAIARVSSAAMASCVPESMREYERYGQQAAMRSKAPDPGKQAGVS